MLLDWQDDNTAHLRETDPVDEVCGVLSFSEGGCDWWVTTEGGHPLDIDPERSEALREERVQLGLLDETVRDALIAEWRGRVHMFRDETRDLAEMGARVIVRRRKR